jgi:hypothetical protein
MRLSTLSTAARLAAPFSLGDVVRESGTFPRVAAECVRQHADLFETAPGPDRVATTSVRDPVRLSILIERMRERLPAASDPESDMRFDGESRSRAVAASERVLFDVLPSAPEEAWPMLLAEARTHIDFGIEEASGGDGRNLSRLERLRRLLDRVSPLPSR